MFSISNLFPSLHLLSGKDQICLHWNKLVLLFGEMMYLEMHHLDILTGNQEGNCQISCSCRFLSKCNFNSKRKGLPDLCKLIMSKIHLETPQSSCRGFSDFSLSRKTGNIQFPSSHSFLNCWRWMQKHLEIILFQSYLNFCLWFLHCTS